jgi:diguanylate cyclase (GGDEF)-like protein
MISIRKFLEADNPEAAQAGFSEEKPQSGAVRPRIEESGESDPLSAWRAALESMTNHGAQAIPALGPTLESVLAPIIDTLTPPVSGQSVSDSRRKVDEGLGHWAELARQSQAESRQAVRDLLALVTETSKSTGARDEKFSREIGVLSERIRAVAALESLPVIRRSIMENTASLNQSVTRMTEESREAIRRLSSEVAEYQTRLEISERRALLDPLTGLANRRAFEQQLENRVKLGQPFSLLIADLNGFKNINDRYGHAAGDEILKNVAEELRQQFGSDETIARWGGDEFAAIVGGPPEEAQKRGERLRRWVLGDYKISHNSRIVTVNVDSALGIAAWDGAESGLELFTRADEEMYRDKRLRLSAPASAEAATTPAIAAR